MATTHPEQPDVSVTGTFAGSSQLKLAVFADRAPTLSGQTDPLQPVISGPIGSPQRYEITCPRPTAGTIAWEMAWTRGTISGQLHTTVPTSGPVILWPKREGPKYSVG